MACRCTSGLLFPMAILSPLFSNMSTSLGISPIVAISASGMDTLGEDRDYIALVSVGMGYVQIVRLGACGRNVAAALALNVRFASG